MGLFKPIWMTNNFNKVKKAKDAVSLITDQDKLVEVALKAPLDDVKSYALFRIKDENVLKQLYYSDEIPQRHLKMYIVASLIHDKKMCNEIALNDAKKNEYYCAYERVNDDEVLRNIILDENFKLVNYGRNVLLKSIRTIDNNKDIDYILEKFKDDNEIVRLANNQKDKINGVKGYIAICPTCHKEVIYDIYWDYYDERQHEKSHYMCGCNKYSITSIKNECELKKVKHELEDKDYMRLCYNCGRRLNGEGKCTCELSKKYIPISVKVHRYEW